MRKKETVIFTNACMILDGKGNVLLQNRVNQSWSGLAFPGGHVEAGESFTDAVVREVFEETGLTVTRLHMCGVKDWFLEDGTRYVVHLYQADGYTGTLRSSEEGEMLWVPLKGIEQQNLASGIESQLRFLKESLTEQFFYKENGEWVEVMK